MKRLLLLFIPALACLGSSAQDSTFIQQYKAFRAATDSFRSYTFQLRNDQNKRTIYLNSYQKIMENAYHFLRNKELKNKKADCNILIAVKKIDIILPLERKMKNWNEYTIYEINTHYKLTVHLEVYRKERLVHSFPLMEDSLLTKLYSYKLLHKKPAEYESFGVGKTNDYLNNEREQHEAKSKTDPNLDEIKDHVIALLRLYKNYYIDQVDWKYSN